MTNLEWLDAPDGPGEWWVGKPGEQSERRRFFDNMGRLEAYVAVDGWATAESLIARGFRFARYVPPVVPKKGEATDTHSYRLPSGEIVSGSEQAIEQVQTLVDEFGKVIQFGDEILPGLMEEPTP